MLSLFVKFKHKTSDGVKSTMNIDDEEKTQRGSQAQREKPLAGKTKIRLLFGKRNKEATKTEQQPLTQTPPQAASSPDKRFVPTCDICGEKHWPFHRLVPCINIKKAKARAKEEK